MSSQSRNVGTLDSGIRIVLGVLMLASTVIGPQTYWGLLGLVPLFTGIVGFCPLYSLLGLSTCPREKDA